MAKGKEADRMAAVTRLKATQSDVDQDEPGLDAPPEGPITHDLTEVECLKLTNVVLKQELVKHKIQTLQTELQGLQIEAGNIVQAVRIRLDLGDDVKLELTRNLDQVVQSPDEGGK